MLRSFFLFLSTHPTARKLATTRRLSRGLVRRFVAGDTLAEALGVSDRLNSRNLHVSLNQLGEMVEGNRQAEAAAQSYRAVIDGIASRKVKGNVSVKLTQLGLGMDRDLCESLTLAIAQRAHQMGGSLEVDMEGSPYTSATLAIYKSVLQRFPLTRIAIQAYLHRTDSDLEALRRWGACVRLVKGAYREPKSLAVASSREVNRKYRRLTEWLLKRFDHPAIGTHNDELQQHALDLIRREKLSPERYEFQFVYGIRRDLVERRCREGHRVRVYVPFGQEWYPYFMRRLAERPANVWFVLNSVVREAFS